MKLTKWFVYVLEGQDGTFYSGITWRDKLCPEEVAGLGRDYIGRHGFKQLTCVDEFQDLKDAQKKEREISLDLNKYIDNT